MKIDPKNPEALFAATKELFQNTQGLLLGVMDELPESFKPQFTALKAKVDSALASIAATPTTQVPAAQEAAYALNHMASALAYMKELYDSAMGTVDRILKDAAPKMAQLNEFNERVTKKELLDKAEVEAQLNAARDEAVQAERARAAVLNERRSLLQGDNLPVPQDEAILGGDEAAFTAVRKSAGDRVKVLRDGGYDAQLNAAELAELAYGPQKDFDRLLKLAQRVGPGGGTPEPLAGGGKKPDSGGTSRRLVVA